MTELRAVIDLNDQREAMRAFDEERTRIGMSVGDLQAKSGVSVSSFYAWQRNERSPCLANLVALAAALGFEIVLRRSYEARAAAAATEQPRRQSC